MPRDTKVSIIQGSGSGHEPAHTMIVGPGMLDAACPGDVFAGPPVEFVVETSKLMNSKMGILHIVNNYTGDKAAFEMGRELCEAEGLRIETLLVNDDVAVKDSTWTVGRRGVAGNFFVIKAVGAASEAGADLDELVRIGNKVIGQVRTMGVALSSCTPPTRGTPLFEIADDEMEVGIGIHGEPGRQRTKIVSADAIVDLLLDAIVPDLPFVAGDEVAVMINGLGGTPITRALPPLRHCPQEAGCEGHQGLPQLRRRVLHVARDGRRAHLAPQGGRRAQEAAPRPGRDRVPGLLTGRRSSLPMRRAPLRGCPPLRVRRAPSTRRSRGALRAAGATRSARGSRRPAGRAGRAAWRGRPDRRGSRVGGRRQVSGTGCDAEVPSPPAPGHAPSSRLAEGRPPTHRA